MMEGAFVAPAVIDGITDASATRNPRTLWTRRFESTTASASAPILAVPTGAQSWPPRFAQDPADPVCWPRSDRNRLGFAEGVER